MSFREVNTSENNACLEFLDVEHKIDSNFAGGFYTRNFVKPTAIDRTFLNGKSFHPQRIFKSIVFSESIHLRRLNESQSEYLKSLECLRKKCIQSNFKTQIVEKIISLASTWTDRFKPNKTSETKTENFKRKIVWATSFPNFLKLEARELHLVPNANIVFKRPPTLFNIITNYKVIAHNLSIQKNDEGLSHPCNKCALCGNFKEYVGKSMVTPVNNITTKQGKQIFLKQNLTCSNFGIYAAQCKICKNIYVGQTINAFSTRWSGHRTIWNSKIIEKHSDRAALLIHYHKEHKQVINSHPVISSCFDVIFLEEPKDFRKLDFLESDWINRLYAQINITKTVLPKFY